MTESQMASEGTEIFCLQCGKRWNLNEDGTLTALNGETEFSHIPDWFEWERSQVRQQVRSGAYVFDDAVEIYSMPRSWTFFKLGNGKLTHDPDNGFVLTGFYRGKDYRIHRKPLQTNSLHIEYDFLRIKPFDCVDISTENDSFYCYPTKENVITKLAFATEEIYAMHMEKKNCEKESLAVN